MSMEPNPSPHPRYRLLECIGKGGMGEVFRTQDRLTGQVVALKRVCMPQRRVRLELVRSETSQIHIEQPASVPEKAIAPSPSQAPPPALLGSVLGLDPTAAAARMADRNVGPASPALRQVPNRPSLPIGRAETVAAPAGVLGVEVAQAVASYEPTSDPADQALRLHLTQEFRTLAGLRHPHIVSVLDYGFDRVKKPYFTMELLDGAGPLQATARGQPFAVRLGLILQILQALTYLHRRGILHRDLKPSNILVLSGPGGPQIKLLDFGLAMFTRDLGSQFAEIAGTVGYMAPEVLVGAQPSVASDLFSVGVMAHELLLGTHPLGERSTGALLQEFLGSAPIFTEDAGLGDALSAVLRRAMCRTPDDRYIDAAAFCHDLARAAGLPVPNETTEIRESFLQAATFVAREQELATLRHALGAAAAGNGSVWLIGGESGVGKSRLLDELRTLALVRGMRVVRGQAVDTGRSAYQVWEGALRPLCLDATLDELDAGVLRAVVPDIAMLLDRPVPEPPQVDPQNAQARFLFTAQKLLLSQREPLLLLLEDLHWAEPASIGFLARLVGLLAGQPLLVVGTYRNDERPDLPNELQGANTLRLPRLSLDEMASLSASVLGGVGRRRDVVTLLERETEGNAFFIVEVLRSLAEEVGALEKIGAGNIPTHVVAGGVQSVLFRRLGRVPTAARSLLAAAAVYGRELDLVVLRALKEDLCGSIEDHLAACAAVAVLEVSDNHWRFAHDKLRETLLAEISRDERRSWHRRIGEAMVSVYAADLDPHAAALGYHFEQAHQWDHALHYRVQAGKRAMQSGAVQEAVTHLELAISLFGRTKVTPVYRAQALGLLSQAYDGAGRPEQAAQTLERMYADAGFPRASSPWGCFAHILRLAARHTAFQLRQRGPTEASSSHGLGLRIADEQVDACIATSVAAGNSSGLTRSSAQIIEGTLIGVTLAEQTRHPAHLAPAYNGLGVILSLTPLQGLAASYLRRSRELVTQTLKTHPGMQEHLSGREGFVHINHGQWAVASELLNVEIAYRRRIGDWSKELFSLAQQTRIKLSLGETDELVAVLERIEELARRANSALYLCFSLCFHSLLAARAGEFGRARRLLREAEQHERLARDRNVSVFFGGYCALCALRDGDPVEARRFADATLKGLLTASSLALIVGIAALVETYFCLWSEARTDPERVELHKALRQSLGTLRTSGALFPIDRPIVFLWHGQYAAQRGHTWLATWLLQKALAAAERYRMPFEEGLAREALAKVADSTLDPQRAMDGLRQAPSPIATRERS